ncbi:MAG: diacylglycerol kinase family lipid kinase [bacterium]|nr:diacylglycerol kinase family lipid kinase [bacterium]
MKPDKPMKLLLIYNPHAGHNRAKKILPDVIHEFESKNIDIDLLLTEHQQHAIEFVRSADFSHYDGVVAAGGDGTLFEVINGYFQNPAAKRIPIGVLPVGTGNAFARDLELTNEKWKEAIDIISRNKPRPVDVGYFKTAELEFYYLNILGMGFVSDVTQTAFRLKTLGNVSYTFGVFYQTIFLKANQLKIELDGVSLERENIFVEISNTRYTSNFLMAPTARIDDGLLDVTLLSKVTRRRLLSCFPKIFTGEHVNMPEVETSQAKSIRIETDIPKVLTPDGEIYGYSPLEVSCLHHAVQVFGR